MLSLKKDKTIPVFDEGGQLRRVQRTEKPGVPHQSGQGRGKSCSPAPQLRLQNSNFRQKREDSLFGRGSAGQAVKHL